MRSLHPLLALRINGRTCASLQHASKLSASYGLVLAWKRSLLQCVGCNVMEAGVPDRHYLYPTTQRFFQVAAAELREAAAHLLSEAQAKRPNVRRDNILCAAINMINLQERRCDPAEGAPSGSLLWGALCCACLSAAVGGAASKLGAVPIVLGPLALSDCLQRSASKSTWRNGTTQPLWPLTGAELEGAELMAQAAVSGGFRSAAPWWASRRWSSTCSWRGSQLRLRPALLRRGQRCRRPLIWVRKVLVTPCTLHS